VAENPYKKKPEDNQSTSETNPILTSVTSLPRNKKALITR